MYQKLVVAIGVGALALGAVNLSAAQIVVKGKLLDQKEPIATRKIYTPTTTGFYNLSIYATVVVADPNSTSSWSYTLEWTDDSGVTTKNFPLYAQGKVAGPWGNFIGTWGAPIPIEVKADTPISFAITQTGPADKSEYSLYWTLEKLE